VGLQKCPLTFRLSAATDISLSSHFIGFKDSTGAFDETGTIYLLV